MNRIVFLIILSLLSTGVALAQQFPPTNTVTPGLPLRPQTAPAIPFTLTPAEWQELQLARQNALKSHPELLAKMTEISQKMRDFQQKLDAAVVETDPNMAPFIARLKQGGPGQHVPFPPQTPRPNSPSSPPASANALPSATPGH